MSELEHSVWLHRACGEVVNPLQEPDALPGGGKPICFRCNRTIRLEDAVEYVPAEQLRGAVDALEQIARVLDRGTADERKLATINRLVHAALASPSSASGRP